MYFSRSQSTPPLQIRKRSFIINAAIEQTVSDDFAERFKLRTALIRAL
jgi:hypothetical protein